MKEFCPLRVALKPRVQMNWVKLICNPASTGRTLSRRVAAGRIGSVCSDDHGLGRNSEPRDDAAHGGLGGGVLHPDPQPVARLVQVGEHRAGNGQGSRRDLGEPLVELGVIEVAAQHPQPGRIDPLDLEIGRQGSGDGSAPARVAQVDRGSARRVEVEPAEAGHRASQCDRVVRRTLGRLPEVGLGRGLEWDRSAGIGPDTRWKRSGPGPTGSGLECSCGTCELSFEAT